MTGPPRKPIARTRENANQPIYCFAYGPIVNLGVRNRRRLRTLEEPRPAFLPEFRLSFGHGGFVNLVRQRGYEVHGVLLRFSQEDWDRCRWYDEGYNQVETVEVFTYTQQQCHGETEIDTESSVCAYTMVTRHYDSVKSKNLYEELPSERYLKLIASGLREHGVDRDYIEDQIMNIPFEPTRKPGDYQRIPQHSGNLRGITLRRYQKLCQSRPRTTYFALGSFVVRLGPHDPTHPAAIWVRKRLHGQPDGALIVHRTFWEPDLPTVEVSEDLLARHLAWCENFLVEFLARCGISLTKVYQIVPEQDRRRSPFGLSTVPWKLPPLLRCFKRRGSLDSTTRPKETSFEGTTPLTQASRPRGYPIFPEDQSSRSLSSVLFQWESFRDDANSDVETVYGSSWFSTKNNSFRNSLRPTVQRVVRRSCY